MFSLVILLSVCFSSLSQILLKIGAMRLNITGANLQSLQSLVTNPYVIGGIVMQVVALAIWLYVLRKVQVSYAYPFVAFGFILVLVVGRVTFGDTLDLPRIIGIGLIVVGILCLSFSHG